MNISKIALSAAIAMSVVMTSAPLAQAEEAAKPAEPEVAEKATPPPARPRPDEAKRAEMRARREKMMAERRAAMEAKMLEVVKKYISDEAQAKALVNELRETMMHPRHQPKPPKK